MKSPDDSMRTKLRNIPVLKGSSHDAHLDAMPDTPHEAFSVWLDKAIQEGVTEPHAMTLSTVDENGWPDARVLILKNVDHRGWHFAIKTDSPKGQQIINNQHVALTFYWPQQARQVRIRGIATQLSEKECTEDFMARPAGSKISAMASKQSKVLNTLDELQKSLTEAQSILEKTPDLIMSGWKVYAAAPDIVEFWQGKSDRLHERLQYTRTVDHHSWEKQRLWP
ncbi:pyridoxamine 5'-phosphate oxidase [Dactylonectria estremocensis]|uniref:pyridoxal 5'-phosphate synthase n=1 Tax=Dactylonectria estremocensis TaxID=1079267 RepID=A0A9P9JFJ3_9HYPO|nr:pyridoxamine 5'-phosphate oxidase [Dactylonectria estremocensis]